MRDDFVIFILSHGRADSVKTVDTLNNCNYDGKYYIVIDDEDNQAQTYYDNFGKDHVIQFCKADVGKTFDIMDNFDGRQVPTFGRNVLHNLANSMGYKYFLELEDDYTCFRQRYLNDDGKFCTRYVRDFNSLINATLDFLDSADNIVTVAWAQTGDFLGGSLSAHWQNKITRKAMNCFFCRADRPFQCLGRFNDDVNAYINYGKRGYLFFTVVDMCMDQCQTQSRAGGITDAYKHYGTYVKSFYSVMLEPSCVKVYHMGHGHKRLHHIINWDNAYPKILSSRYKKEV